VPFSYAQYAGNGSATTFSVPFPYLLKAHVKLYTGYNILNGTFTSELVDGTGYVWTSGTQVQTTVAPAGGVTLTVIRQTPSNALVVQWQDGSNLIAQDLIDSDRQNLYVVQEQQDRNDGGAAAAVAAQTAATAATAAATAATTTATTATATATAATTAASTATAAATASTAASTAATTTANQAAANAAAAVTTAGTASSNASAAVTTANAADGKADQALSAVATAILYDLVANVAGIPAAPSNNDAVEVFDSTGIESFTPLAGKPAGFVGDSGLSVRIVYSTAGSTWNWIQYFPNDPETRYGDAITTLESDVLGLDTSKLSVTTAASTYLTQANAASTYQSQSGMSSYLTTSAAGSTYAPLASPTFTGTVTIPAGASISGYLDTTTASTTYQTQAGMSGYLATGTIGTTVQAYDADTAKTDVTQTYTAGQRGEITTLTDAATIAVDFAVANNYSVELAGNRTLGNPTNQVAGQSGSLFVVQDGSGSRTLAYSSDWEFAGGTAPTLSTAASAVDRIDYIVRASGSIHAVFTAAYS
jgi:hypothetical protein